MTSYSKEAKYSTSSLAPTQTHTVFYLYWARKSIKMQKYLIATKGGSQMQLRLGKEKNATRETIKVFSFNSH